MSLVLELQPRLERVYLQAHQNFNKRTAALGANDGTVTFRAWQGISRSIRRAESGRVHLSKCTCRYRNCGERSSHDGDQTGPDEIRRLVDVETGDLNRRQNSADD